MTCLTSDFLADTGCPENDLRAMAAAGFTHVHWCHHWHTDFIYGDAEISQIERWLKDFGLRLLDLHGTAGREKCWGSLREYERQAGVELVRNRLEMTARLGGDAVVLHLPDEPQDADARARQLAQLRRSLDELEPTIRARGVRIAIENLHNDSFVRHRVLFAEYSPEVLGLCYDIGHGHMGGHGLDHLETLTDRLIATHLHDNDGNSDQHLPPFMGTADWPRFFRLLARARYTKVLANESCAKNVPAAQRADYLPITFAASQRMATLAAAACQAA